MKSLSNDIEKEVRINMYKKYLHNSKLFKDSFSE
jgi:hypothetical protein